MNLPPPPPYTHLTPCVFVNHGRRDRLGPTADWGVGALGKERRALHAKLDEMQMVQDMITIGFYR